jgi:hypothetical protein
MTEDNNFLDIIRKESEEKVLNSKTIIVTKI